MECPKYLRALRARPTIALMPAPSAPLVSLVLLHCNKAAYSRACLASLLRSSHRPLQVINVDNGSRDETPQVLAGWQVEAHQHSIEAQTLSFDTNIGAIRGRNEAMARARGEFIAFLDNDTLVAGRDWIELLLRFLELHPRCGIVAPLLQFPFEPFAIECAGAGISAAGRVQYIGRGQEPESLGEPFEAQALISAAWLMRRVLVDEIGMLDEAFSPVQYEDLDFCYRARAKGWQCWVETGARLFHFEHTTTAGSQDINFRYVTAKNGLLFKKRWASTFAQEDGPAEADTAWRTLEKKSLEEVDTERLLPS